MKHERVQLFVKGDIKDPRHDMNTVYAGLGFADAEIHSSANLDLYTFKKQNPIIMHTDMKSFIDKIKKQVSYCVVEVIPGTGGSSLALWSSEYDSLEPRFFSTDELLDDKPVPKMVSYHYTGILNMEWSTEEQEKEEPLQLKEEEIQLLKQAREEANYPRALSLVNKVFPDKKFHKLQGLKAFCTKTINQSAAISSD